MVRQLPNFLSVLRFVLTPFAVLAILKGDDIRALWLCLAAGATDLLDGYAARALGVESRFGALLDPLADKFMLDALYLVIWLDRGIWAGALVIARDVLILGGTAFIHWRTGRRDFPPRRLGKLSTVVQIGWIVYFLSGAPGVEMATWALIAATVISGIDYARAGWRMI